MFSHRFLYAVLMSAGAVAEAAYAAFPNARFPASFSARAGTQVASIANGPLVVRPDGTFSWPGVSIRPAGRRGVWDWSGVGEVSVVVSNGSDRAEYIHAAVVGEGMSLDVAPARGHDGVHKIDPAAGYAAHFEPKTPTGTMTALVIDPSCRPATVAFDATGSLCLLVPADRKLVFYAGAAWSGAGVFPTAEKWFASVKDFAKTVSKRK